ncbi:MAG: hypothetical protein EON86_05435 [Brevundimonas sp.]|nr:MAG: hypothetical protein EON86_05435 [Brevundimonas sp.]
MSSFNYLIVETNSGRTLIQFKWGWTELIEYRLNDTLKWFDFPKPDATASRLEISGVTEQSPAESAIAPPDFYKIIIKNDVIVGLEKVSEPEWRSMKDPSFRD